MSRHAKTAWGEGMFRMKLVSGCAVLGGFIGGLLYVNWAAESIDAHLDLPLLVAFAPVLAMDSKFWISAGVGSLLLAGLAWLFIKPNKIAAESGNERPGMQKPF